jgi:hypothetical protein
MTSNPPDELDELIGFLADKRADARAQAAEIVQGLTGSDDGTAQLVRKAETLVPKLLHLMGAPTSESKPSTTALVNLTASPDVATRAVEKGAVERAMEFLRAGAESDGCPPDLLLSLLANVTNTEGGVHVFSQDGKPLEGFFVTKLVQMLAASEPKDAYDHAASVLTNVARHPAGRRALLDPKRGLIFAALPSMSPPASETRRCGVAAALRNCCVDEQSCASLLAARGGAPAAAGDDDPSSPGASAAGLEIVRALLRPISGIEPAVERCDAVRQSCAEAVASLAQSEIGRAALGRCDAPALVRAGYAAEEHAETCEAMERAAERFLACGMVPPEMQPPEGVQRVEVVDEGEEEQEEVVVQGGPRPLTLPDVD